MKIKLSLIFISYLIVIFWTVELFAESPVVQIAIRSCNAEAAYHTLANYADFKDIQQAKNFKENQLFACYQRTNQLIAAGKMPVEQLLREDYIKFFSKLELLLQQHKADMAYLQFYKNIVYYHFGK